MALTKISKGLISDNIGQVVQTVKTDTWSSSTTTSWVDITGFNVTITPTYSTSKILVTLHISLSNYSLASFRLLRGSTVIALGDDGGGNRVQATIGAMSFTRDGHRVANGSIMFLDSPNTTNQITYKIQTKTQGGGTIYVGRSSLFQDSANSATLPCSITAMEVSA